MSACYKRHASSRDCEHRFSHRALRMLLTPTDAVVTYTHHSACCSLSFFLSPDCQVVSLSLSLSRTHRSSCSSLSTLGANVTRINNLATKPQLTVNLYQVKLSFFLNLYLSLSAETFFIFVKKIH